MIALDKQGVFALIRQHRAQIRRLGVRRLGLFGSFATGQPSPESDIDLLVEFHQGCKSFDAFLELATLLEACLGRKVELVTPEALSPHLGPHILRQVEHVPLDD